MRFSEKTVWITGASSGLGAALAKAFSAHGARLVLSARNREALEETARACGQGEGRVHIIPFDIRDMDAVKEKAAQVEARQGSVDILVNNAGVTQRGRAAETITSVDRAILETNLLGPIALTKAVLPGMIQNGSGHVVVTSSVLGKFAIPEGSAYSASKHGLHGFFDSLRAEVARYNIQVTLVCPGYIRTDITLRALRPEGTPHGKLEAGQARGLSPERCAEKMLEGILRGREELVIAGPRERLALALKRIAPRLLSYIMKKRS